MIKTKLWVQTEGSFLILLALMLLLLPLQWVLAAAGAACFHELCHYAAIRLLGGDVYGLRLGINGAKMEVAPLAPGKELVAALAGPVGSAFLVLLAKWLPRLAICGFVHCVFNLLPLFPLDGGRALRGLMTLFLPDETGQRAFSISQQVLLWGVGFLCILCAFKWGIFPAILGITLIWRQRKKRIWRQRKKRTV